MLLLLLSLLISCSRKTTTVYIENPNTAGTDTLEVDIKAVQVVKN